MRVLHNLILCEFQKFKRRRLFLLATLAAFVFPALTALMYWNTPGGQDYDNLFSGVVDPGDYLLLLPVLVVLSTTLFFTEQDSDTLKNLITIPISKGKLVLAKISVMAVISVVYSLAGFLASAVCAKLLGIAFINIEQKFIISLLLGLMMLAAALPCLVLVVWFNKNNLISIVITLFYTIINYVFHLTDLGMKVSVGFNIGTILPIPLIQKWIFQFYSPGTGASAVFYESMRPYFVSTPVCIGILTMMSVISTALMIRIYNRREL
ncbi:MAG: ABC transporter permease [Lachnospiraceae bacterium]|nr:ABC transporter permease [Lachnospiraceae bacterium]